MASYRRIESNPSNLADWMARLPESLTSAPLRCLAIPGSHASFSCTVRHFNDIAPDSSFLVRTLGHLTCCLGKERIYQWNRTQDLTVKQQLTSGIRYFDVQVSARTRTGDFRVVCGLFGEDLSACMKEIKVFLDHHEKEVIIFDINQFYKMNDVLHMKLLSILTHCFDDKLCPYNEGGDVSLESLWNRGQQVIVIYHHDIINEYENFWPGTSILYHPDSLAETPEDMVFQLEKNFENDQRKQGFDCYRGFLSLSKRKCLSRFSSSRKLEISRTVAPIITSWLKDDSRTGLNIIVVDFVHLSNFVLHVVNLNTAERADMCGVLSNGKRTL